MIFSLFKKNSKQFDYLIYLVNDSTKDFCMENEFVKAYTNNQGLSIPSQIEMKFFLIHLISRHSYYIHGAEFQDKIFNTLCSKKVFGKYNEISKDIIMEREKVFSEINDMPSLYEEGLNFILCRTFKTEEISEMQLDMLAINFASTVNACDFEKVIKAIE